MNSSQYVAQSTEQTAEASYLQAKIEETYQDLAEHVNESAKYKKEKVKSLEGYYRKLITGGELKINISDIAKTIIKGLNEHGIPEGDISQAWIYKNVSEDCHEEYNEQIRSQLKGVELIGNDSTSGMQSYKFTPINELTPSQVQDEVEQLDTDLDRVNEEKRRKQERFNELVDKAKREKIALTIPVKADPKSTPKPESAETALSDELQLLSEDILAVREKVIEFPPDTAQATEWAKGMKDFRQILKGFIDEKYSKSIPEWFRVQITNQISGKHAAGVKHATMLPGGIKRNLTREQVGDNAEFILDAAWKALNSFDALAGLISWHRQFVEVNVAQRKVDLSPDLSDKA